jgi:transcriptional regulator with XRE-family HTH domain
MLHGLKRVRITKGLSQEALSSESGVHRDSIHKLETGQRPARPATIKKLADALGVGTEELAKERKEEAMEQTKTGEKVEVEVRWEDSKGFMRGGVLRFRGEDIDYYEERGVYFTLYECPGGYRVHVDHADGEKPAYLYPSRLDPFTREVEYSTYTVEKLVEKYPVFGSAVGVMRVRDID